MLIPREISENQNRIFYISEVLTHHYPIEPIMELTIIIVLLVALLLVGNFFSIRGDYKEDPKQNKKTLGFMAYYLSYMTLMALIMSAAYYILDEVLPSQLPENSSFFTSDSFFSLFTIRGFSRLFLFLLLFIPPFLVLNRMAKPFEEKFK